MKQAQAHPILRAVDWPALRFGWPLTDGYGINIDEE
jgi:hypothetical protein